MACEPIAVRTPKQEAGTKLPSAFQTLLNITPLLGFWLLRSNGPNGPTPAGLLMEDSLHPWNRAPIDTGSPGEIHY